MSFQEKNLMRKIKRREKKRLEHLRLKQNNENSEQNHTKKITNFQERTSGDATSSQNKSLTGTDNQNPPVPGSSPTLELTEGSPFSALKDHVCEKTLKAVEEMGFTKMTDIQAKVLPILLAGKAVVASSKTGSGKTLAFLIPTIEVLYTLKFKPRNGAGCIVLSPTRELSIQTYGVLQGLMAHHKQTHGLVMGGENRKREVKKLENGLNYIVATPGRLLDHMNNTNWFITKNLFCLVIDEVDRMLEIGFEEDIKQIINLLPKRRLTMVWSATMTPRVLNLTKIVMGKMNPTYIGIDQSTVATVEGLNQVPGSSPTLELTEGSPFSALKDHVCEKTLKALEEMGFTKMTEIQAKVLPILLAGKAVVASSKTGSGKTLAFLIPTIEVLYKLKFKPIKGAGCIVLSPTRELSIQTYGVLQGLMAQHHQTHGLIMGGENRKREVKKLKTGLNYIVATPGRLLDHMRNTKCFMTKNLCCLVIDEVDRMLEIGLQEDIKQIIDLLPKRRLTMVCSATMTPRVLNLTKIVMDEKNPTYIGIDQSTEVATVEGLTQGYVVCPTEKRWLLLFSFLKKKKVRKEKVMVFFSSCHSVQYHHDLFNYIIDFNCMCIHGKQKQNTRTSTFFKFCNASDGILLCTDVAARGLDFPDVDWIIQYDPPQDPQDYIHRVGRTAGGQGSTGNALLILQPEEKSFLHFLHQAHIPLNELNFAWDKVFDCRPDLERLLSTNYHLRKMAREAYIAYVRTYRSHRLFDISKLDPAKVGKSFGLLHPPAVNI